MDKKTLGNQIQKFREEMNIGQEAFAELIGVSQVHVSFIERGTRAPSLKTLIKISSILKKPIDILITGEYCKIQSVRSKAVYNTIESFDNERRDRVLDILEAVVKVEEKHAKNNNVS